MNTFLICLLSALCMLPISLYADDIHAEQSRQLQRIEVSADGSRFVLSDTEQTFKPWGFNFVGRHPQILEEYWFEDWADVEEDFHQMKALGANVVRVHLQLSTFMTSSIETDERQLQQLKKLLDLADRTGLFLDLTGLGCYHKDRVPEWFSALSETQRWQVQANFWDAIAKTCQGHTAVFCYNLMNEPVIGKPKPEDDQWLLGELGGMHFVQRISNDPGERTNIQIAKAWVKQMVSAIRKHDSESLITVGVIPWAQVWPNAKPLFYAPEVAQYLDFVSVHFYPKAGEVEKAVAAVQTYNIGKPIVVEEIFPLNCSLEELDSFIDQSSCVVEGWISHYFGKTISQHQNIADMPNAISAKFLEYWQNKSLKD